MSQQISSRGGIPVSGGRASGSLNQKYKALKYIERLCDDSPAYPVFHFDLLARFTCVNQLGYHETAVFTPPPTSDLSRRASPLHPVRMSIDVGALKYLRDRPDVFQPRLVDAIEDVEVVAMAFQTKAIYLRELRANMVLDEDLLTENGLFVIAQGQIVSEAVITRLRNFARSGGIRESFRVLVPAPRSSAVISNQNSVAKKNALCTNVVRQSQPSEPEISR